MKNFLGTLTLVFASLVMVTFLLATEVFAYPQEQYQECILAVKSNPAVVGLPEISIESFCDCALTAIVDEGRNDENSAKVCAREKLNN